MLLYRLIRLGDFQMFETFAIILFNNSFSIELTIHKELILLLKIKYVSDLMIIRAKYNDLCYQNKLCRFITSL
jgi:hypothetical protein